MRSALVLLALLLPSCDSSDPRDEPLSEDEIVSRYSDAVCSWATRCRPPADFCPANMEVQMANRYELVPGFPREMADSEMAGCEAFADALSCDSGEALLRGPECNINPGDQ